MFKRIKVGDKERVLVTRDGRFRRILGPGVYWLSFRDEAERYTVTTPLFPGDWTEVLIKQAAPEVMDEFTLVETGDTEIAIVRFDGKVAMVIEPARRELFWKTFVRVEAEVIDVRTAPEVPATAVPGVMRLGVLDGGNQATFAHVEEGKTGLLFLDNRIVRTLAPGTHGFWKAVGQPRVEVVDQRLQPVEIAGQEILTKDKVSIRVNITGEYRVVEAVLARQASKDVAGTLYRALKLAVRQSLGRKTLDEILAEKVDIDPDVASAVRAEMLEMGVELRTVALKDIIPPGEVRDILTQVVAAEKQAQANLIRRREETAATRSLLNTARLLEENPILIRLKELETLEKLTEKVDRITVSGGLDSLLTDLLAPMRASGKQ